MSGSFNEKRSSDFTWETHEMNMQGESGEEFIPNTFYNQNSIEDDIDIKHEAVDFHHESTADADPEGNHDYETESNFQHVDCGSDNAHEMNLNELYHDLLQCKRDCETCQRYLKMLREHVRAAHVPRQPFPDPLLVDPLNIDPEPPCSEESSSVQIKSECNNGIEEMEASVVDSNLNMESDPDFEPECESESDPDPDYTPPASPHMDPNVRRQGLTKNKASKNSKSIKDRIPTRERSYKCDQCEKSFTRSGNLTIHKRKHTGEKPYKCDVCDKRWRSLGNLNEHKRVHTGEKPFQCDVCQKSFSQSNAMTSHRRSHTGEKPFKCDVCQKSFSQSSHFTLHKRIHTGERPYKCDMCVKSFTSKGDLTVHKRIHTGEKPYECTVCGKRFVSSSDLGRHKKIHTNTR